jgi:hypothetical protein
MSAPTINLSSGGALALGAIVVGGVALWWLTGKDANGKPRAQSLGEAAGTAVVDAAEGAATGVVLGVGDAVGVPRTDTDACQAALAAGDYWEASFKCPAGTFLSASYDKVKTSINPFAIDTPASTGGATGSW